MTFAFFVRLSVCLHVSGWLPLDIYTWNLTLGIITKICQKMKICLKSDKNVWHFTWDLLRVYCWQQYDTFYGSTIVQNSLFFYFRGNIERLFIVDSFTYVNKYAKVNYCCYSMTTKFKRTCHNDTLHLNCLFCPIMYEHFRETFCPALSESLFKQKFDSAVSSRTLVLIFQLTLRHVPEFYNLNTHCARNVNHTRKISVTIFVDYGQKDP